MIISASRRTDIPAFYVDWFFNRLRDGYVYAVNPFNRKQVSRIPLSTEAVDCFVFWTKDPSPMICRLNELMEYKFYFQFTLTSYRQDAERNLRPKREIIKTFKELSGIIGKEKVIWRYDPIFLNDFYSKEYHYEWFEKFMEELHGYTEKCIISFMDYYKKAEKNMKNLYIRIPEVQDMYEMGQRFSKIGSMYGIPIETCAEKIDLSMYGIGRGKCIDRDLISRIIGRSTDVRKDDSQRKECGCAKSVDIGQYNTCLHNCAYCYANFDHKRAEENCRCHNPNSPLITGGLIGDEKITQKGPNL